MSYISKKIRDNFPDASILKNSLSSSLFSGRNLPSFVKDYLIRRFSDAEGHIDADRLRQYFDTKMPDSYSLIKSKLLAGERVNITTRFIIKTDIAQGKTLFTIPDAQIDGNAYVSKALMEEHKETLVDGEIWGNITMEFVEPKGRTRGYISMVEFRPFQPYRVSLDYYRKVRENFDTEEWIDFLVTAMEYNSDKCGDISQKLELVSRLLVLLEPGLNVIELGPKGTGKSYMFNNFSKNAWVISGGKISRAKMFYNKNTKQYGLMKNYDAVAIDEISTFGFIDNDEMQSIFKSYLEAGTATVDNVKFLSDCSLSLMGNLPLNAERQPMSPEYYKVLPVMFHESATLDRFHGFIEGWKLPRLEAGSILSDWTLDVEYLSSVFHLLRTCSEYEDIFNSLISYDSSCDLRDLKAVRRLTSAYHKLLFPHVVSKESIDDDFRDSYNKYCLLPAIRQRGIIRKQCHYIDKEFKDTMPEFSMK